jgi:hypothetical protein
MGNAEKGVQVKTIVSNQKQIEGQFHSDEQGTRLEAACPFCSKNNVAHYGPDGKLIWWVSEAGTWCSHAKGAYSGGGLKTVFHFQT